MGRAVVTVALSETNIRTCEVEAEYLLPAFGRLSETVYPNQHIFQYTIVFPYPACAHCSTVAPLFQTFPCISFTSAQVFINMNLVPPAFCGAVGTARLALLPFPSSYCWFVPQTNMSRPRPPPSPELYVSKVSKTCPVGEIEMACGIMGLSVCSFSLSTVACGLAAPFGK